MPGQFFVSVNKLKFIVFYDPVTDSLSVFIKTRSHTKCDLKGFGNIPTSCSDWKRPSEHCSQGSKNGRPIIACPVGNMDGHALLAAFMHNVM